MSFFERIENGWELVKRSLKALREDKEIILFPILSIIFVVLLTIVFVVLAIGQGIVSAFIEPGFNQDISAAIFGLTFLVYLLAVYFVTTFFKSAIITSATIRFDGKNPSFGDGLKTPAKHILRIFFWSLILLLVNIIVNAIRNAGKSKSRGIQIGTSAAASAVETAWKLLMYFTLPILLFEELSIWQSMKKSTELFKKTWGENILAQFTIGGIFFLIGIIAAIPAALIFLIGFFTGAVVLIPVAIVWLVIEIAIFSVIQTSVDGILIAALYSYATSGKVPKVLEGGMAQKLFAKK